MQVGGCDEGYLKYVHPQDNLCLTHGLFSITRYCEERLISAVDCVQEMRDTVFKETKLTVSAGIAPNKVDDWWALGRSSGLTACF